VTPARAIFLVARRELRVRVRSRPFLLSTAITAVALVAVAVIAGHDNGRTTWDVGAVGPAARAVLAAARPPAAAFDGRIRPRAEPGDARARSAVRDGDLDAAVLSDGTIAVAHDRASDLVKVLQAGSAGARAARALARAGVDRATRAAVLAPRPAPVRAVQARTTSRGDQGIAFLGALLLYIAIIVYGLAVAYGVVEEKGSRVVEIIVATVRPAHLLAGKVLGIGLAGLGQVVVVAGAGVIAGLGTKALAVPSGTVAAIALVVVEFLLGYAFYSAIFAACAAMVSRQEDLQSVTAPITTVLVVAYIASNQALQDPEGTLAQVMSILPFTSPLVLPGRVALHVAATGTVVLSLVLLLVAVPTAIALAARLYRGGVLSTGARLPFRLAWQSAAQEG
jgi:ABC-2 type transport system permease protein